MKLSQTNSRFLTPALPPPNLELVVESSNDCNSVQKKAQQTSLKILGYKSQVEVVTQEKTPIPMRPALAHIPIVNNADITTLNHLRSI